MSSKNEEEEYKSYDRIVSKIQFLQHEVNVKVIKIAKNLMNNNLIVRKYNVIDATKFLF